MTIFAQGVSFLVQIVATVVLARLLTPADFGLVTMVTTFSLLVSNFGFNGFTEAILQREEITHSLASNLFWINLGCGAILTLGFAALAPLMARFYHEPSVARVAQGMSLTIICASFSVVHNALLNRGLCFTRVSVNSSIGRLVYVMISILLALVGWGYWALVAGCIAQQVSISVGVWLLCRWAPSLPRRALGTAAVVKFAMNVYSHFAFSYFSGNTDNLLVGRQFAAQMLGFYKKAFDLFTLPANQLLSPISAVVVATLSRFRREHRHFTSYFLAGMSVLAFLGMGIGVDLTLIGRDLVRVLLGPGWDETGRIFEMFGPGIGVMLLYGTHSWLHLSIGRPDRWFRWGVIEFVCTATLFVVALRLGPEGIALAWTASYFLLMFPAFWYAGQPIGLGIGQIANVIWRFFVASVTAGFGTRWFIHSVTLFAVNLGATGALARLGATSLVFFALYLSAVIVLHRGFGPIRQIGRLAATLLPERFTSRAPVFVESTVVGVGGEATELRVARIAHLQRGSHSKSSDAYGDC